MSLSGRYRVKIADSFDGSNSVHEVFMQMLPDKSSLLIVARQAWSSGGA